MTSTTEAIQKAKNEAKRIKEQDARIAAQEIQEKKEREERLKKGQSKSMAEKSGAISTTKVLSSTSASAKVDSTNKAPVAPTPIAPADPTTIKDSVTVQFGKDSITMAESVHTRRKKFENLLGAKTKVASTSAITTSTRQPDPIAQPAARTDATSLKPKPPASPTPAPTAGALKTKEASLEAVMTELESIKHMIADLGGDSTNRKLSGVISALADTLSKQSPSKSINSGVITGILDAADALENLAEGNMAALTPSSHQGDQLREAIEKLRDAVLNLNDRSRSIESPAMHRAPAPWGFDYGNPPVVYDNFPSSVRTSQTRPRDDFDDRGYNSRNYIDYNSPSHFGAYSGGDIWTALHREIEKRPEAQLHTEAKKEFDQVSAKYDELGAAKAISKLAEQAVEESLPYIRPLREDLFETLKDSLGRITYKVTRPPEKGPIFMPCLDEHNNQAYDRKGKPIFSILYYKNHELVPEKSFIVRNSRGCRSSVCAEDQDFCKAKHSIRFIDMNYRDQQLLEDCKQSMLVKLSRYRGVDQQYQTHSRAHRPFNYRSR